MGQEPPARYIRCINRLFEGSSAEGLSSLASAKVFDVEAEVSTMNRAEAQAVKIIIESPWHLCQPGVLTLRNIVGQKVCNQFNDAVIVVGEYWKMSESQKKTLMSEGVTRHIWEKCPLSGHSVPFHDKSLGTWPYGGLHQKEFLRGRTKSLPR